MSQMINSFKLFDRVRHLSTGIEMDIIDFEKSYDFDKKKSYPCGKIVCSYIQDEEDKNSIIVVDASEIELINREIE